MDTGDLVEAVRAHRVVELEYRGRGREHVRVVHPHAVYRTSSGALRVDGLQVAGASSSGALPGWRDFDLIQIAEVRVLDTRFEPAADYRPGADRYRHGVLASA